MQPRLDHVYSEKDTSAVAQKVLDILMPDSAATIVALAGEVGAGKTTLVQSMAKILGVRETLVSPTFVIAKFYTINDSRWQHLIHIDAYRIEHPDELTVLGWEQMIAIPETLIVVEWPERIKDILPSTTTHFQIKHPDKEESSTRHIYSI